MCRSSQPWRTGLGWADRPIAIEVFEGNTADPATLVAQISKLKERFGLKRIVLVGDRGMITEARIDEEIRPAGFELPQGHRP